MTTKERLGMIEDFIMSIISLHCAKLDVSKDMRENKEDIHCYYKSLTLITSSLTISVFIRHCYCNKPMYPRSFKKKCVTLGV